MGCGGVEQLAGAREAALKSEAGRAGFHSSRELRQRRATVGAGPCVERLQVLEAALGPPGAALGSECRVLMAEAVGVQVEEEDGTGGVRVMEEEEEVELTLRQMLERPRALSSATPISSATMSRQLPMLRGRCGRVFCCRLPNRREVGLFLVAARGAKRLSGPGKRFVGWHWKAEPSSRFSSAREAKLLVDAKSCCRVRVAELSTMFSREQLLV